MCVRYITDIILANLNYISFFCIFGVYLYNFVGKKFKKLLHKTAIFLCYVECYPDKWSLSNKIHHNIIHVNTGNVTYLWKLITENFHNSLKILCQWKRWYQRIHLINVYRKYRHSISRVLVLTCREGRV